MDKDFDSTLDLVLDIQNSISLNPFDRPPNIMDEELNSVTQEELEANLSTDCPVSNVENNTSTSLQQLIQSVLEDTSTQDAVEENDTMDTCNIALESTSQKGEIFSRPDNMGSSHERSQGQTIVVRSNGEKHKEQLEFVVKEEYVQNQLMKNEQTPQIDSHEKENSEAIDFLIKQEEFIIEASQQPEELTENPDCYFVDTINDEDAYNDLCQVEVYASNKDVSAKASNFLCSSPIKKEPIEDGDSDSSSASSVTIGHLEAADFEDGAMENDNDKESHLSVITSDHCYSQEVTPKERDVLKERLISYMAQKYGQNDYQQKISNLADKILYGLDNNVLDKALDKLTINDITHGGEESFKVSIDRNSPAVERLPVGNGSTANICLKMNSSESDAEKIDFLNQEGETAKAPKDASDKAESTPESVIKSTEDKMPTEQTECGQENSPQNTSLPQGNEINFDEQIDKILHLNKNEIIDKDNNTESTNSVMEVETNEEPKNDENILANTVAKDFGMPENQFSETASSQTSSATKHVSEYLTDNCSEPLEHRMFDEEFELLCKTGSLSIENRKSDSAAKLIEKLNDFVSLIQKDCEAFSSASTNIEQKLQEYISQKYESFQELFKPYCVSSKQSIETQTDFKPLTKRHRRAMNMESKTNLLNPSDSSDDDNEAFLKAQKNLLIHKRSARLQSDASDSEQKPSQASLAADSLFMAPTTTNQVVTNCSQEYDDGIILSQYVQSEIFDRDSASVQSPLPSSVEDSDSSAKELQSQGEEVAQIEEDDNCEDNEDSVSTLLFNVHRKKSRKPSDTSSSPKSSTRNAKKYRSEDASPNSESDKENLSIDRKEKKSLDSVDEDEKNDKEIERLINIDGLSKRCVTNTATSKSSEKSKPKSTGAKSLNDHFDFMDVEFGSDDEVKSETEEETITEKQFLERRNEEIKRQLLNESSTDSDEMEEEDDAILKISSEEDESGKNSPLVEKFLKTFVVDDSDNDIIDEDDDLELESDKDEESASTINKDATAKEDAEKKDGAEGTEETKLNDGKDGDGGEGETLTASDAELLNDNLLFRKKSSRPQKLDKMLSDAEKRKKISKIDEQLISLSSESDNSDVEAIDDENSQSAKPRAIKPMLRPDQLAGETIKAQKSENERISRLERKHNMLEKVLKEHPDVDKNSELILDYIKETKTFIKVNPAIVKQLKPHQFDGVRFMYDSCYGGVDALKKSPGSGCILAHCMGLGKTLQLISLLHTVISYKELKTTKILVLCPKSTVMNWADEILRWLGPLRQKNLKVYTFSDTSDISEKLSILREWSLSNQARAGCLLIGYEAFRTLVFYHSYKNRGNVSSQRLEQIRKNVNSYLLQPGADLVICDEGHIIKNSKSAISMAVAQIVTPRRIVLTGTPIQNNLKEYYSMVNFIKPLFLGTEKEFANLYANPIKNGQHKDSGKTDIKVMKQRSFVLHKKLSKFVQRKEAELLKTFLPQKFEYVLFIPMTDVQNNLYQYILTTITNRDDNYKGKGLITDYTCLRKIWTHPKVLEDAWKNAVNQRNKKEFRKAQMGHNSEDDQPDDIYDSQTGQMSVTNDWWRSLVRETDLESVMPSNKLRTMFKILQMCEEKGEKCLIFSAFVAVLNVVEYFFRKISDNDLTVKQELGLNSPGSEWVLGKDYYRLDGKTPKSIRHAMINEFNNVLNKRARVFLISAKAGGQGINLIGANRVIILDTSWNPSNDQQNIFRVFRLGQKRNCYIYRLLAMGTMEEKVYSRSVTKQAMSFRVVDEQQIDRHYSMAELAELYTLTLPDHSNRPTPILPQDSILARLLRSFPEMVYKYHEHDSLLENKVEQELSEQEKNEAWTAYERDLQMSSEQREIANIEDLQNKFNASNIGNYLSPFSGLDVSNNNTANANNSSNNKNMSHFFGGRGFGQPLLQSLLGPNNNPSTTQQYIDMLNYYKNLGTYADLNSYTALMNAGRMAGAPTPTSAASNPLAALGDLSMYGLTSPSLQGLGPAASTMNLANSVLAGALPQLQTPSSSAGMYTSAAPSMLASTATNAGLSSSGLTNTTNSAALSAFEQYAQSLRGSFPNMYSYASDFGLGSSGSTILDKSKSNKSSKQSSGGSKNSTNLPGGSKNINSMSLYPGSSTYITPHPQQQTQQQQQQQSMQQQSRPSSRNAPVESTKKSKSSAAPSSMVLPSPTSMASSSANTTTSSANTTTVAGKAMVSVKDLINASKSSASESSTNSLINYRRSDSTGSSPQSTKQNQKKIDLTVDSPPSGNVSNKTTTSSSSNIPSSKQPSKAPNTTGTTSMTAAGSNQKSSQKPSSKPALNMGILYPNSKNSDNKSSSKPNSPMNMGIVYPRSQKSSNSEMQIIPTSSPPGTTSISKQLNELSPSISLTAVKNTAASNKSASSVAKPNTGAQNIQINKVLQNNTTIRRTVSPVASSASSGATKATPNAISGTNNSIGNTSNPNNFMARFKASNSKKPPTVNSNNPPPLHRANTTLGTTSNSNPAINMPAKTSSGLTITNVKNPIKPKPIGPNKPQMSNISANQATTLAKQQAAASVAKSNIQRTSMSTTNTANSNTTPNTKMSSLNPSDLHKSVTSPSLPSLTSIKRTIIKRQPNTNSPANKLPAIASTPSLTVTASNKRGPIIKSVKSISPSMATITKTSQSKTNAIGNLQQNKQNLPSVANVSKAIAQMQKRPSLPNSSSSSMATNSTASTGNAVNIRPVDSKQNPTGSGNSVYIIETNINDKKVAIGTPTKSGGGTTVTKVLMQNPNKRKITDAPSKDTTIESKRPKI